MPAFTTSPPPMTLCRLRAASLALLAVLAPVLAACGDDEASTDGAAPEGSAGWTFADDRGETITLDAQPERVVADQMDQVAEIAPVAVVEVDGAPAREVLANYERVAVALGADVESDELVDARAAYDAAAAGLTEAATAEDGLTVLATYADNDGLYIAEPADFPDLLEFRELGVDIVEPDGTEEYWEMLSWEQADAYPADLLLHDVRSFSLQPDALASFPTWVALPAVQADQVGAWSAETVLSYQGLTVAFEDLTTTIEGADPDVVP